MRKQFVAIVAATTLILSITPANAQRSSNTQLSVEVEDRVTLSRECATIGLSYKISPLYRETPAWIEFRLQPSSQYRDEITHSRRVLYYNIDMNTGKWRFNNEDFFGTLSMKFCKSNGFLLDTPEVKSIGLTKTGRYYLSVIPQFVTNPNSVQSEGSDFSIPIEIKVITSIICQKGSQKKKVTSSNPKCPKGFKELSKQTSRGTNASPPTPSASPTRTYVIPKDYKGEACFPYKTRTYFIGREEMFTQLIRVPETPYDYRAARRVKGTEFSVSVGSEWFPPSECTEWVWPKRITLQYPTDAPDPPHEWWGEPYSDRYKAIMESKPAFESELYFIEAATPEVCEVVNPKSMPVSVFRGYASVTVLGKQAGNCKLTVKLKESNWYRSSENYIYYVLIN